MDAKLNEKRTTNAYFNLWVKEISNYPSFINEIELSKYEAEKFLDFLKDKQTEWQSELNKVFSVNPGMSKDEIGVPKFVEKCKVVQKRVEAYLEKLDTKQEVNTSSEKADKGKNQQSKGFKTLVSDPQFEHIFHSGNNEYFEAEWRNFEAAFTNETLPENFEPIKWLLENSKGNPNKTALREFLANMIGRANPNKKQAERLFCDKAGKPIEPGNRKKGEQSKYKEHIDALFPEEYIDNLSFS